MDRNELTAALAGALAAAFLIGWITRSIFSRLNARPRDGTSVAAQLHEAEEARHRAEYRRAEAERRAAETAAETLPPHCSRSRRRPGSASVSIRGAGSPISGGRSSGWTGRPSQSAAQSSRTLMISRTLPGQSCAKRSRIAGGEKLTVSSPVPAMRAISHARSARWRTGGTSSTSPFSL